MTIHLTDDAFSVKAKRFNKMFTSILALFFLLRNANKSHFYAPNSRSIYQKKLLKKQRILLEHYQSLSLQMSNFLHCLLEEQAMSCDTIEAVKKFYDNCNYSEIVPEQQLLFT